MTESLPATVPTSGRLAGIDYGTVRIGVALSDATQTWVSPWEIYARKNPTLDLAWFQKLVTSERVVGFVLGLPVHTNGNESQKSIEARKFGKWLSTGTSVPVVFFDERFSSAEAERLMQDAGFSKKGRKERIDKLAAQIILTTFLESNRQSATPLPLDDTQP